MDFKEIQQSFVANFIQFCDATICHIFLQKFTLGPCFTIHDRFFCSPFTASFLKPSIAEAYLAFYKLDLLENNFKDTIFIQLLANAKDKFTESELALGLNNVIFVKP